MDFPGITVEYNRTRHGIYLARLCVKSNYPFKMIHLFNLLNTFYHLFRHIYMSPDSPVSHMKIVKESLSGQYCYNDQNVSSFCFMKGH